MSTSLKDVIAEYIENQLEHHKQQTYQEEFLAMLEKHGVEYDPKYVWE